MYNSFLALTQQNKNERGTALHWQNNSLQIVGYNSLPNQMSINIKKLSSQATFSHLWFSNRIDEQQCKFEIEQSENPHF